MTHEKVMELILDHYYNPRNYGEIDGAPIVLSGGNNGCGDLVTVYLDAGPDGAVRGIGFTGEGCMVSRAGASIVLEMAGGMTVPEMEAMSPDLIRDTLGKRLALTRHGCVHLGLNTLKAAIGNWRRKLSPPPSAE
ncbi:MAG: iron-sulfur cluster assembly scaffold protein [Candidatus Dadabacteria bacterium]|nr:iron-sulfur cluster assembly scaffold protein [Candidatus Dadabacteria bacterium]